MPNPKPRSGAPAGGFVGAGSGMATTTTAADPQPAEGDADRPASVQMYDSEKALWRRRSDADSIRDRARDWLTLQCQIIEGATRAVVLLAGASPNSFETAAFGPEGSDRSAPLAEIAELALRERRGVASGDGS